MALKFKITKAEYDKLPDVIKDEYVLTGDSAQLDLEGAPPAADPKASEKFTNERDKRRAAEKRAKEAEEKLSELEAKAGDVAALETKQAKEVKKLADERDAATKKYTDYAAKSLKDGVAGDLATKLAGPNAAIIRPHILSRVTVDMTGDEPKTVFLDKDGKPSALTADDVAKEFRDNKDFSAIIVGTRASGGGASRTGPSGNGNPGQPQQQQRTLPPGAEPPALATLSPRDLAATLRGSGVPIGRVQRQQPGT